MFKNTTWSELKWTSIYSDKIADILIIIITVFDYSLFHMSILTYHCVFYDCK